MRWMLILLFAVPALAADEFESVCVIPGFGTTPAGNEWTEDQVYVVVKRTVDGTVSRNIEVFTPLDWGTDPNYCWFVDCAPYGNNRYQPGQDAVAGTPAVSATYKYTYISTPIPTKCIYGLPLGDGAVTTLDADDAVNVGGGIVGINYDNANEAGTLRFVEGENIIFGGTTNYTGTYTLTSGTSATQLQFTSAYTAETFDGTEVAIKYIGLSLSPSLGRMAMDSSGNLYLPIGLDVGSGAIAMKIDTDGNEVLDFLNWESYPYMGTAPSSFSVKVSDDDLYLYILYRESTVTISRGWIEKYNLTTGDLVWSGGNFQYPGYDFDVDPDGNVFAGRSVSSEVVKFAAADGAMSDMTATLRMSYDIICDDTLGIVICAGEQNTAGSNPYNLAVRTFDNASGDTVAVGGVQGSGPYSTYTIANGCIASDGEYIYVLITDYPGSPHLFKYSWNGSALTEEADAAGPQYGMGIYVDLWGNVVVLNQVAAGTITEIFYYYDTDLNLITSIDIQKGILKDWVPAVSAAIYQGDMISVGELGSAGTPGQDAIPESWTPADDDILDGLEVCVYADGIPRGEYVMDGNDITGFAEEDYDVVIAGLNYWSIYESPRLYTTEQDRGRTDLMKHRISTVNIDFWRSMGADLGVDRDNKSTLQFSDDDFATAIEPYTGYFAPIVFPRGMTRDMTIYLEQWEPIPMSIRGIYADMETYDN